MSLTSKDTDQTEIDFLILDFGLYESSKYLRKSLLEDPNNNNNITIMDLNTKSISTAEWDKVVDNILKARSCITL